MHPLPQEKRKAVLLFVEGESVLHGTLPTSSLEPTVDHSNIGSALVTKRGLCPTRGLLVRHSATTT